MKPSFCDINQHIRLQYLPGLLSLNPAEENRLLGTSTGRA